MASETSSGTSTEVQPLVQNQCARRGALILLPALIWALVGGFVPYALGYYTGADFLRDPMAIAAVASAGGWIALGCGVKGIVDYRRETGVGGFGTSVMAIAGGSAVVALAVLIAA